jgi:hypothetical protein
MMVTVEGDNDEKKISKKVVNGVFLEWKKCCNMVNVYDQFDFVIVMYSLLSVCAFIY